MFNANQCTGKDLDTLVRTALLHGELSPGVAAALDRYRSKSRLNANEQRQLEILDNAIMDGCIVPVQTGLQAY